MTTNTNHRLALLLRRTSSRLYTLSVYTPNLYARSVTTYEAAKVIGVGVDIPCSVQHDPAAHWCTPTVCKVTYR